MVKVQNLEATLSAIIFICDVFHLTLQEQDHLEGAGLEDVQKCCYLQEWDAARFWVWPPLSRLSIVWPSQAQPF